MRTAEEVAVHTLRAAKAARIALVQSRWHQAIVARCRESFLEAVAAAGVPRASVDLHDVPGVFEIPLMAKLLARTGRYDAVVAMGLVVDGGIYRHEFVAGTVIDALMAVQLETLVPVISAVLTPQHFHEHETHAAFFRAHMDVKGREAAAACLATCVSIASLRMPEEN